MRAENVMYFTEKEEEFVNLLTEIGMKRIIAKVLVFLGNIPEATSHVIERGTDLRQPEVSIAINYMTERDWIKSRDDKPEGKGRPLKVYALSKPIADIMDVIEKEKKDKANRQLQVIQKLRKYI